MNQEGVIMKWQRDQWQAALVGLAAISERPEISIGKLETTRGRLVTPVKIVLDYHR
jgi:hypothetical protein